MTDTTLLVLCIILGVVVIYRYRKLMWYVTRKLLAALFGGIAVIATVMAFFVAAEDDSDYI